MKNLYIPSKVKDRINIYDINLNFNGLIIGYKDNKEICYIQFDISDSTWYAMRGIDSGSSMDSYYSNELINLIKNLIKDTICDYFQVLEFELN